MTVNCQEGMVEAQASKRIVASTGGASTATIESLRARLLSERAASKEARQQAHKIAQKVSELQSRLDAEVEHRKKAEAAMKEVLEALKDKGLAMEQAMATTSRQSESSESEEAAPSSSSKDGESEHSSGEEALRVPIGDPKGSVDKASHAEDVVSKHEEGCISEDNSSDKTQITLEVTSRSDSSEVEKEGINKDEEGSTPEQAVITDPPKDLHNVSLFSGQAEEEGDMEPPSEILSDLAKLAEGRDKSYSNGETGVPFANHSPCLSSADHVVPHQELDSNITPNVLLSAVDHQVSAHAIEALHPGAVKKVRRPQQDDTSRPGTENVAGATPKDMHPGFFPKNGYPYDMPNMYSESLKQVHNVPFSAEVPFPRGPVSFPNTAYQSREHLSSEVTGFGRYPQAPISDAILSLVDDKKGKLGSILMALQLAKQQLNDQEHVSSYMEEKFETPTPSPILYSGNPYTGFYDEAPYQPPYQPWRTEPHNAAPIIHFPVSPTSDHEVSAFERHDGLRRSSSTSAYYMPPVYDAYIQPKGELHLGNGITLYTD